MVTRNDSLWKTLDWVTIAIYLLLIIAGWFSVCGASYDYGERDFLDFSTRAGKQFMWIICPLCLTDFLHFAVVVALPALRLPLLLPDAPVHLQ